MSAPEQRPLARYRQLAPSASVRVSPLCLGAMTFGGTNTERYGECSKQDAYGILDYFYENGGNFIDTANTYQNGQSEVWVGEWMAARNNRDEIVLATKYTSPWKTHVKGAIQANFGGNGTKSMRLSVEDSLRKLQTSYIDLFYVHWWDFTTSIPEMMQSLNDLVVSGKVMYLGISDTPAWVVSKANQYARDHGLRQFTVYQGMWSAAMRDFERDIIPMCRDEGMGLCPYGTLNQGRFQTAEGFKEREKSNPGRKFIPTSARDKQVSAVLETMANKRGVSLLNIALAYVFHKAPYVFPILGARKVDHLKGNVPALSVALSDEEILEIESAYEFDHGFPHSFLSGTLFDQTHPRGAYGPGDVWLTKNFGQFDWVEAPRPIKPGV
ncbi:sterigmatocystin biosynthesis dehydrogenase stcV [Aspergillus ambiguus]|uniref:aldo/keto reductase n=1 Tax=Aspergillus ambiguus TaxID=176160 RepID=UPI003CCE2CCF